MENTEENEINGLWPLPTPIFSYLKLLGRSLWICLSHWGREKNPGIQSQGSMERLTSWKPTSLNPWTKHSVKVNWNDLV